MLRLLNSTATCIVAAIYSITIFNATTAIAAHPKKSIAKIPVHQNQNNIESAIYLKSVKQRLEHFWCPARSSDTHATVTFRINKDGRISWVELTDAASDTGANLSAVDAVTYSSPFPKLSSANFIDIAADFNSDFCPQYCSAYLRPSAGNLEASGRLYSNALNARKLGHLDDALHMMQEANKLMPNNIYIRDNFIDLCIECSKSQKSEQAMCTLRQALLLDPSNEKVRNNLNALLAAAGKDPANYDLRLSLARNYESAYQYDDAVCEYGEAWLLKQDQNLIPEINLACQRRCNYAAICKWKAALKIADSADCHAQLGRAYEACDETQNAILEYQAAIKLNPSDILATSSVARLQSGVNSASNDFNSDNKVQIRDDFPYVKSGNCNISVAIVKDRKASVDYLKAACGKHMTRWASNQTAFRLYVDEGRNVPGYRSDYRPLMISAFDTWVKASGNRLSYKIVNTPQEANIVCYWVPRPTPEMTERELGHTKWSYVYHKNEPNLLMPQSAQVVILSMARNSRESISGVAMRAICLHEIGHTLGITGHSPYVGDVMYATLSPFDIPKNLSERDMATIKRLYQGYSHKQ